ncbi:MAG: hypothetical protein EOS82_22305, partial [Mesorhizobium sp.]|uniref:hypothetical protein n=1 Tax=Mesorhizobium sp. TaxID=1871066 RepID=UPI000FE92272
MSKSNPSAGKATTLPSATIHSFEPSHAARQLRAMLPGASTVTLFHYNDEGKRAGLVTKPIAEIAAAIHEARNLAGDHHVFAALTGLRLAFKDKASANAATDLPDPSYALNGPGGSIHLVYLMKPSDRLATLLTDRRKSDTDDAYTDDDVPLAYGEYGLHADDLAALEAGEDFKVYEVEEFEAKSLPAEDAGLSAEAIPSIDGQPTEILNDAEIYGEISDAIWNKKLFVSTAKKRDEKFFKVSPELSFSDILVSNLSKIRVGQKDGACLVPGVLVEGRRLNNAVTKLYMMGLDVDSGASMEDTIRKLQTMGLFFVAYTTHSHGTTTLEIKKDKYFKWATDNGHPPEASVETVKLFLTDEGKYTDDVIASVSDVNTSHETSGIQLIVTTRPIDKFRLLFVLAKPYVIAEQEGAQKDAIRAWGDMILGMGSLLGISVDRAARDCSRLFYLPSKAKGSTSARVIVSAGKELDWRSLPRVTVTGTISSDPFDQAANIMGGKIRGQILSPQKGLHLQKWTSERAHGFQISSVFRDHCDDRMRAETGPGKFTVECPFDDDHSNAGDPDDPGCFIQDAGMDAESFTFRCSHDSCAAHDRLAMLEKAMVDGWFTDDVLTDPQYDISGADEVDSEGQESQAGDSDKPDPAIRFLALNALIKKATAEKASDKVVSAETMEALMDCAARQKSRVPIYDRIKASKLTGITDFKNEVERRAKDHAKTAQKEKRKKSAQVGEAPTIYSGDDFPNQCGALLYGLRRLNDPPYMFLHGGDMKRLPGEAEQHSIGGFLKRMSFTDFKTECNGAVSFVDESKDGDRVASLAEDIPAHLWGLRDKPVPVVDRFTRVPVFGPDGTLRTEDGYDATTRTILQTSGLNLDPVPPVPSIIDLATAKDWLFRKALADFPFVDDFGGSESGGDGSSSRAHTVVMLLHQIARELYTGPTPFFFIDKPQPGSGAGLLVEVLYQTIVGRPASPQALGRNEDEIRKGITAKLSGGSPIIFYDNVRNKIHGEALAILGTADWWE